MRRRRAFTVIDNLITGSIILILSLIIIPIFARARHNARRASCQSNLRQLVVALRQYTADSSGGLPPRNWVSLIKPYAKKSANFRCPSKSAPIGAIDYFFNARFLKGQLEDIQKPQTLVLLGDGNDDSPLRQFPRSWLKDESSPAWRHIEGANYAFADGHIKWLKPGRVKGDFRMVQP